MLKKTPAVSSVKIDIDTSRRDSLSRGDKEYHAAGGYAYILLSAEWALKESPWAIATGCRPQRGMELVRGRRLILFVLIYSR